MIANTDLIGPNFDRDQIMQRLLSLICILALTYWFFVGRDSSIAIETADGYAYPSYTIEPAKPYRVTVLPKPKSPLASILSRDGRDDEKIMLREVLAATAPLADLASEAA